MTAFYGILAFIVAQRLVELLLAARNTARLRAAGGIEHGARHYPLFIILHGGWLVALALSVPGDAMVTWPLFAVFVVLQACRVWVVASLGRYWTTRVITVPGAPLVKRGPYRFVRHPNYLVVIGEIALVPLMVGAWELAIVFSLLNLALLRHRIAVENAALIERH